jgi:hypothetical protein
MIPIDDAAVKRDQAAGLTVVRHFEAFRSPVDGSIIRNHRELEEHNRRNNVVSVNEFDEGHYRQREEERRKLYTGEFSRKERLERRQEIYERWISQERR